MPYKNLEWRKDKDIQSHEETQAFFKVSKLHTHKWNNATTKAEEKIGGRALSSFKLPY